METTSFRIEIANWSADKENLKKVRSRVFIEEQSVAAELEWDGKDEAALHWLALTEDNEPIGTVRMLSDGHIGRMAVLADYRRQGVGRALLQNAVDHGRHQHLLEVYLYAQTHALAFYRREGFIGQGEEFMDANIAHLTMRLPLVKQRQVGIHSGDFSVDDLKQTATELVAQTQQQLRILSYDLDRASFDSDEMQQLLSSLARKSRYTDIRILIVDPSTLVKYGHKLLTLQRRLPSKIKMRKVSAAGVEVKDNLLLADQCAIICQSIAEPRKIWANFNNKAVVATYTHQFDELWARSVDDKDLRQLA